MRTGIFTTLRVEAGHLWQRARHRERLLHDAALIERQVPELAQFVRDHLDAAFDEAALAASKCPASARCMARLVFEETAGTCLHAVEVLPARRAPWRGEARALELSLCPDPRPDDAVRVKWLDRSCFASIEEQALAEGCDGILLHGPQNVHEGTWFHLVAFIHGGWCAPGTPATAIYGATRAEFLAAARVASEPCREGEISLADLAEADAVFALSSLLGGAPIARIGPMRFPLSERFWRQRPWVQGL